jgi:HlyD family secretion protein
LDPADLREVNMRRSIWLAIAAVVTVASGAGVWALRPVPEVEVDTAQATAGPIVRRVVATGTVQALTTVEIGSQVSGTIQTLGADFNSIVKQGQVIARLDPSLFVAARDQAAAALQQARAAEQQAQTDLDGLRVAAEDAREKFTRAKALSDRKLIPQSDLDAAQIAVDAAAADVLGGQARVVQARGGVAQAQASLDQSIVTLDRSVIRAPIDGIVVERDVDVGQTVASSVQSPVLFRLAADLRHVQVQVDIDESDIGGVTPGETATFEVESYPNQTFHGVITQLRLQPVAEQTTAATTVATSTSAATTTQVATVVSYTAIIAADNVDERLRPGMTAEVAVSGARVARAVRIPNNALAFRPSNSVLQALGGAAPEIRDAAQSAAEMTTRPREVWRYEGNRLTPVSVHVGLSDDQWTEVTSGQINAGDSLATNASVQQRGLLARR